MFDDPHLCLGALAVVCGVAGIVLSRRGRAADGDGSPRPRGWRIDGVLLGLVILFGIVESFRLMRLGNPYWVPFGQDFNDFLGHLADVASAEVTYRGGYRYYLYPWVVAPLIHLLGMAPYVAGIAVSLIANGLIPASAYLLGRQLSPRPVALAGALLVVHLPALLAGLGQPSDYSLTLVIQVGLLAAGVFAIRSAKPWALLLFGVTLALFMGVTSKALPTLLVAIPAGLIALPWRSPRRAALGAAGLLLPLVGMWLIYAAYPRQPRPLEYNLYQVDVANARQQRVVLGPEDYGWPADVRPEEQGTWRVGSAAALAGLPATLRFLTFRPEGYPPLSSRLPGIRQGLEHALALSWLPFLWLVLPGCLAAALPRAPLHRRLLAAGFLTALVASLVVGPTRLPFAMRFFQPFVAVVPTLALAGLALVFRLGFAPARRDEDRFWWPLPALALVLVLLGPGGLSARAAAARVQTAEAVDHPLLPLLTLRSQLEPDDVVVDLTLGYLATALFAADARIEVPGDNNHPPFPMRELTSARRIVVLCAPLHPYEGHDWVRSARKMLLRSERHEWLQPCVFEDLEPESDYTLIPTGAR